MQNSYEEDGKAFARRDFLRTSLLFSVSPLLSSLESVCTAGSKTPLDRFKNALKEFQADASLADSMRPQYELAQGREDRLEKAPIRASKSSTSISSRSNQLIIACEVTSEGVYTARYQNPVWPGGASGVTIGIGYDLGQASPADLKEDWAGYLKPEVLDLLQGACGATGTRANTLLEDLDGISIPWKVVYSEYDTELRPRYVGLTEASLKNTNLLSPDSLGALVSLVYNRGPVFGNRGNRYEEMRNIAAYMDSKEFRKIPLEIRRMKRIWKDDRDARGLLLRRDAEADLFELGLS